MGQISAALTNQSVKNRGNRGGRGRGRGQCDQTRGQDSGHGRGREINLDYSMSGAAA